MKKFLAVYTGSPTSPAQAKWQSLNESQRNAAQQAGIKAWGEWMEKNKAAIVDHGGPLGKTKRTSEQGIADTSNNMAAFVIVRAESHEAAAKMFAHHPHFTIFPGDAVEVMECLPIPGQ